MVWFQLDICSLERSFMCVCRSHSPTAASICSRNLGMYRHSSIEGSLLVCSHLCSLKRWFLRFSLVMRLFFDILWLSIGACESYPRVMWIIFALSMSIPKCYVSTVFTHKHFVMFRNTAHLNLTLQGPDISKVFTRSFRFEDCLWESQRTGTDRSGPIV